MELWGGAECTIARIGDRWRDQSVLTGHDRRADDIDRFASLGITALRTPVLWERVAPDRQDAFDWVESDVRMAALRRNRIRPIAGLLHHGSGPGYTSLVDPDFVPRFVEYATAVAGRYPDITDWTPVNEPNTTARFACLYAHWYPHERSERLFLEALFNQVEGTIGAMAAIRRRSPASRLIQTDDLGLCFSDVASENVAGFYNERRWLGWDLLCGSVGPHHPLWQTIVRHKLDERARGIADNPCPPDIIGINHYPTSDRYLHTRPDGWFDDVAAVRVVGAPEGGLGGALREAWDRYRIPIAVTEVHLGCSREEQLRWLWEAWQTCIAAREQGIDMRAMTAWALLGNVDWTSLLVEERGDYEPGAFDVSGAHPRPTAVAGLLKALSSGAIPAHPVLSTPGWWRRDCRFGTAASKPVSVGSGHVAARPILITGASGTLGQALARHCVLRGLPHILTNRKSLNIEDRGSIDRALERHRPWAIINAAGYVRVDDAESDAGRCMSANRDGAVALAEACAAREVHFTSFSSDMVFDGIKGAPYVESDPLAPISVYGRSKAEAEAGIAACNRAALIVRTAAFFSPDDPHNFAFHVEQALREGRTIPMSAEHIVTATYVPDLVDAVLDLVIDGEAGLWHLTSGTSASWVDLGRAVAIAFGFDPLCVIPASPAGLGWRAARPRDASLTSDRGILLPPLERALSRHVEVRQSLAAEARAAA